MFSSSGAYGWMGVDLFFVLSGYLIGGQLFQSLAKGNPLQLKFFFLRRALRTFPLFFVVLAIYVFFPSLREPSSLPALWKYFTFTQNIGLDRGATGAFSHAWSLCVEEQFYLLLPLTTLLLVKTNWQGKAALLLALLFVMGMVLRSSLWLLVLQPLKDSAANFGNLYDQYIYYPTYTRLDGLLVGVGLALLKVFKPQLWNHLIRLRFLPWMTAALFLGLSVFLTDQDFSLLSSALLYPCVAIGFGALLVAVHSWKMKIPGISTLASLSYAVYLIQKLVFHWCRLSLPSIGVEPYSWQGFALTTMACLIFAAVLHWLVERPFLKLRENYRIF